MTQFLVIAASYLIGSIPFSYLFSRLKGVDPRKAGTGNVGASNVLTVAGKRAGALALAGDIAKGVFSIVLARHFGLSHWGIAFCGLAVVLGHDFSIFLRFKGGKGAAPTGGVLFGLDPIFGFIILLLWIFCMLVIGCFIPGTALTFVLIPVVMWMGSWRAEYIVFGIANAALGLYVHRRDLERFLAGKELTIQESIAKYLKK